MLNSGEKVKKVLIISSSFRKGNTDKLCDFFAKGAVEANCQVERVNLRDINLNYCLGCGCCQETGICEIKDDVEDILEKVRESEVIVFATPVYFHSISGQLKTLFDRMYPLYRQINNKKIYVIASCYQNSKKHIDEAIIDIERFVSDIGDLSITKIIYAQNCDDVDDVSEKQINDAYKEGKNI